MFETTTALSIATKTLADFLATASVGETVSFDAMSRTLGSNVLDRRYIIQKARDILLAEHGMRFDSVYKVGLKRMNMHDAIGVTDRSIRKIKKDARKASKRIDLQKDKANDIDDRTRFALNARQSLLGAIEVLAAKKATQDVEKIADERVIPFGQVLAAIK